MREQVYRILGAFAVWILLTGQALAFKQVPIESQPPETEGPAASVESDPDVKLDGVGDEGANVKKGIELKIPGVGVLGVLPKLDFGLELLYGETEPEVKEEIDPDDDLTIRGTVKHRF